jgi:hypothetical protein
MNTTLPSARDHRIDFVRGLALMMIFINHIPGNIVGNLTTRNFGFSDAAEIFVLLAGVSSAFAYYRRYEAGQPVYTSVRVWRRAGFLYTAHILTTVLAIALFAAAAIYFNDPKLADQIGIRPVLDAPAAGLLGLAALTHQLSFFNILPLYIALLVMLPAMMFLYRQDVRLLLAVSLALYLAAGFFRIALPGFPTDHAWFFNPLSWQLLFVAGFCWGDMWRRGVTIGRNPALFCAAAAYLAFSLVWMLVDFLPYFPVYGGLGELWGFSKMYLSPFRLVHVLALAYVIAMSPLGPWLRRFGNDNPLVQIGRHALPIFCVGSLLSMAFYILRTKTGAGIALDVLMILIGVAIQIAFARFLEWQATTPAGQVGSKMATGFVAAIPPVPPPGAQDFKLRGAALPPA